MKKISCRTVLPPKTQRTQSTFLHSFLRVFCDLRGEKPIIKNSLWGIVLSLTLIGMLGTPTSADAALSFQTTTVEIIVHLLNADRQPMVGVTVNLVLNRYDDAIEEVPFGSCVTDDSGTCTITVNDPPHLQSGRIEGFIDLGAYGRQLIGWKGERFEITLQLSSDERLATVPAPLDQPYEGQTEQPTYAPRDTSTPVISSVTVSTKIYPTVTNLPPNASTTFVIESTSTPYPTITETPTLTLPLSSSKPSQQLGWILIVMELVIIGVLSAALTINYYHQRQKKRTH